ncbi:TPA: hypothetical protein ACMDQA_003680 [Vibrio cholerae]|nr:hypothetical protein [Vibrio cholerae]
MENLTIWRYLDFTKYVSLLESQSLFFARLDTMEDPFEGTYPKAYLENSIEHNLHRDARSREQLRRHVAINCWHENEYESAAMWKLYLKSDEGIVIQSTTKSLSKELFSNYPSGYLPGMGPVRYINFELETPNIGVLGATMLKRKSFEHEREYRAQLVKSHSYDEIDGVEEIPIEGVSLPIEPDGLIHCVYVSPTSKTWFYELVKSISRKYGLTCEVKRSELITNIPRY